MGLYQFIVPGKLKRKREHVSSSNHKSQCFFFKICLNKQNRKAINRAVMQISKVRNALYLSVEACIYRSRKYCGKKKDAQLN